MRTPTVLITVLALAVLGAACGPAADSDDGIAGPGQETPPPADGEQGEQGEQGAQESITGALQGSAELEGGCAWLVADGGEQYEVLYPDGYQLGFNPVELLDPDGEVVAAEGDEVTVTGRVATDRMSICQVGTIFEADTVE